MAIDLTKLPDYVVFGICDRFIRAKSLGAEEKVGEIAAWAAAVLGMDFNREQIYPVLAEGVRRNFLRLVPPEDAALVEAFREEFGGYWPPQRPRPIQVVNPGTPARVEHLAAVGAETLLREVKRIHKHKLRERREKIAAQKAEDAHTSKAQASGDLVIRIGVGAGITTAVFAKEFAAVLRSDREQRPDIVLKAISPPFSTRDQQTSPQKFFELFGGVRGVSCEAFNAPSYVLTNGYAAFIESPDVRDAFAEKMKMDIVATLFGSRACGHSDLTQFMQGHATEDSAGVAALEAADWTGDVHRQPYSPQGPIAFRTKFRPVALYGLDDLVMLSADPSKAVILIAGPCPACGETREDALLPLLENERLLIWSHLVVDAATAEKCLALRAARQAS